MRIEVTVQLISDMGDALWAYSHVEGVPMGPDGQANGLRAAGMLQTRIEEARRSVIAQGDIELPLIAEEQDRHEAERRRES